MRKTLLSFGALLTSVGFAANSEFQVDGTTYVVTGENTVTITAGDKNATELVIPSSVNYDGVDYAVTALGEKAYSWSKATSLVIPASVKSVGYAAFQYGSLTSITFNEGLEQIGGYAFSGSKCASLDIPGSVKRIGESAFFGSSTSPALQSLTLHEGLKVIANAAFYGNAIKELEIPASVDSIIGTAFLYSTKLEKLTFNEGLKYIGKGAFNNDASVIAARNTTLTSVSFPSSLTCIDNEAFFKMPLESLTIPAGLETLGDLAFSDTKITTVEVDAANKNFKMENGLLYSKDNKVLYFAPVTGVTDVTVSSKCLGISGGAFWNSELKSIQLPEGLLAIGYGAFYGTAISSITLPQSLTYIDEEAFALTKLNDLVLPENLPYIFGATFFQCNNLKTVTFPSGLQGVDCRAFYGCNNIETVICKASTPLKLNDCYEGEEIFTTSPKLIVPKGCKAAYTSSDKYYKPTLGTYDNNFPVYFWNIQESEQGVFMPLSTTPADGDALKKYQEFSFTVTFAEPVTINTNNPKVFIRPTDLAYPSAFEPCNEWGITANGNSVTIFGMDYDYYTDYFMPEADKIYFLVIPAGTVKNAAGDENEQIVIWTYGSKELKDAVEEYLDIETVADASSSEEVARYGIDGKLLKAPQKGLNIVRRADGSAKKVMVK